MIPVKPSPWLSPAAICVLVAACAVATMRPTLAAQQVVPPQANKKLPVVAYLGGNRAILDDLLTGMRDLGYIAERDFHLEARLTEGSAEKQRQFAAELVALRPDVIVAAAFAPVDLKQLTSTVPIVVVAPEVIALRVMNSLEHPGGNVTGVVARPALRTEKELSLLKDVVPGLRRVAVLTGGTSVGSAVRAFAAAIGLELAVVNFAAADQLEAAFDKLAATSPDALFVGGGPLTFAHMSKIASLARARKWPSISENRELPAGGGLMSYGDLEGHGGRQAARYVDRILKGGSPGDLPAEVHQQQWELVINLESAKQLGLTIPDSVLAQASELIRH